MESKIQYPRKLSTKAQSGQGQISITAWEKSEES